MPNRVLRTGLIGLGAMGRNHLRVLSELEGTQLVAAVDPQPVNLKMRPGLKILNTVEELVAQQLDYAVVACPTGSHHAVGLVLAEAGVHALFEKPLAETVDAARDLMAAFDSRGLIAGVGHIERYNPALQNLRERLTAGTLGEVYQVVTRRQGPFPARIDDVGVVKDLATHDIDLTTWVTDEDYKSVAALTARRSGREHEDMVLVVAELTGSVMANHIVNWLSPLKERSTIVTGERGCYVVDTLTADLSFYANGSVSTDWEAIRNFRGVSEGDVTRFAIARREPLLVEHERFRDAVAEGHQNGIVTAAAGLRTVEISAAVLESAATGRTVPTR